MGKKTKYMFLIINHNITACLKNSSGFLAMALQTSMVGMCEMGEGR